MNNKSQRDIWKEHTKHIDKESIIQLIHHPKPFQSELAELISKLASEQGSIIEVGCEQGITCFLIDCKRKCFFDLNENIIELCKKVHDIIQKERVNDTFVVGDMFKMPFENDIFDVTFNSGVLEHYSHKEIVKAVKEMARITKPSGKIVVGIPNHYSIVYRSAYLWGGVLDLLKVKKWPWPKEYKYYDLHDEIEKAGCILEERIVISKASIWNWWKGRKYFLIQNFFKILDRIIPLEGYLTVLLISKK